MIFRQLIDPETSTYTYLLGDEESTEAILIDPVLEQFDRDSKIIDELGLNLIYTLETHVHADHITSAYRFKQNHASVIAISKAANTENSDINVKDGDKLYFGSNIITVISTPGHTNGCVTYVLNETTAFTGDAILIRGCGRTDFQQGSSSELFKSVRQKIFKLPDNMLLYPGHDYKGNTVTSVIEEKLYNHRLKITIGQAEFIEIMNNLNLSYPKKIKESLPANMKCGRTE
jgi:glyoxylase-like metal-dependent hydrolase (beta-lactamase superfamily II)